MNSKVMLVKNINMDKEYNNVVNYTEQQMLQLCTKNQVAYLDSFSFIRKSENVIQTQFSYEQCLQSNYIAFQNYNYSNKWFFAWIDEIEYKGDNNTYIYFTIDYWSTWFSEVKVKPCYVIRHHVNDDIRGNYTYPEGLETGEYITDNMIKYDDLEDMAYIIQVLKYTNGTVPYATNYGGVYYAGGAYICNNINEVINILQSYEDASNILSVYMCPKNIILNSNSSLQYSGQETPSNNTQEITIPTTLDGYTPKNKKLLTYPYCYLSVSNNSGSINNYYYELFNSSCTFNIKGVPTIGGAIKCVPLEYRTKYDNYNEDEGIMGGKFPTLSWSEDAFTNWLTQNAVNLGVGFVSTGLQLVSGLALLPTGGGSLAGASQFTNASLSLANQLGTIYQHSLAPMVAQGNTNGGDITTSSNCNTFYFYQNNIRQEYAKIIDDYFTRYGYKICRILIPNITGRAYWNYIEIGSTEEIGYGDIPSQHLDVLNNACRKGVTIWHNHDNIGNYALNNTIV